MDYAVQTRELARSFGEVRALDGINLDITRGRDLRVLGTERGGEDDAGPHTDHAAPTLERDGVGRRLRRADPTPTISGSESAPRCKTRPSIQSKRDARYSGCRAGCMVYRRGRSISG